jgi:glycosyltransferase involved in cell wall biosynthesis
MSRIAAAASSVWSQHAVKDMCRIADDFQPDLIHAHNTFPLISPALYWLASYRRIPAVQTLHNFRLLCPQAMFLRNGKVCEDCLGKLPWRAVTRKCYRDSVLQSAAATTMLAAHRAIGSYREQVTSYIVLSKFCHDKFIAGGLPAERLHIKPNFAASKRRPYWKERAGGIFIGRLAPEKGLDTLIEASRKLPAPNIRVAGTGPLEEQARYGFQDKYLGFLPPPEVAGLMHSSLFLVAPSTCYETFGLVAVEAFSCGLPVIASRHGGLGELVRDGVTGLLFNPGDAADLAKKIAWAQAHPSAMLQMGQAAYLEYLNKYTPEKNYHMLLGIYRKALSLTRGELYAT